MEETGKLPFSIRVKNLISRLFFGALKLGLLAFALFVPGGADNFEKVKIVTDGFKKLKTWTIKNIFTPEVVGIASGVFLFLSLVLFVAPFFFNNSALKFQISQRISQISDLDLTINGDVKVALIPYPSITAEDVVLRNYKPRFFEANTSSGSERVYNIYARSVQVRFPIISTSDHNLVKKISFRNVVAESYDFAKQPLTRQNRFIEISDSLKKDSVKEKLTSLEEGFSAKLFSVNSVKGSNLNIVNISNIEIENGEAIVYDRQGRLKEIKSINVKAKISKDEITSEGNFIAEGIGSNFKLAAKFFSQSGKQTSFLEIISPAMELRLKGDFTTENRGIIDSDFTGNLEANIFELKSFYRTYITPNGVIANKLKYNSKPIKISATIANKSKEISINSLAINSALANGKGDIELNFVNKIPLIDIDFTLENLDLDSLWSKDSVDVGAANVKTATAANNQTEILAAKLLERKSENPQLQIAEENSVADVVETIQPIDFKMTEKIRDFDLTSEIRIKSIKYLEGEIKDTNLYLTVSKDGKILVLPLIFTMPGETIFRVNGVLDTDLEAPKFVGKVDASGKNLRDVFKWLKIESQNLKFDSLKIFSLYSDVLLLPNAITLNNFYLNLNDGKNEFLGNLKIDNSNNTSAIVSDFQISDFDADEYFLTSGQNAYLSPGLLVKKLLWLNNISSSAELNLRFDKMIYKGEEFPDQSVKLKFGRGYLEIADLRLKSKETNLKAGLIMDISDKNPRFDLNVSADNFHYKTEQKSKLLIENNISEAEVQKIKQRNFADQFFAMPSLEGFNGKMILNFDNLWLDDLQIKDFKLMGKLKDGNLENSEINCSLYDGSLLYYKGLLGFKTEKVVNGNITFTNVPLQQLLPDLLDIKNISGIANISASISGSASKKSEFIKVVNSEIKFNANEPTLSGYGLNDLVKKMFAPQVYINDLKNPEKILLNPDAKTVFNQANGTIQLNGDKEGRLRINVTAPAVNGILSGTVSPGNSQIEVLFNAIFLTGTRQKQTPINIATVLKGSPNALAQSMNLDQVKQYLGLMKKAPPATLPEMPAEVLPTQNTEFQNRDALNPANPPQRIIDGKATPTQKIEKSQILPSQIQGKTVEVSPAQAKTPLENLDQKGVK